MNATETRPSPAKCAMYRTAILRCTNEVVGLADYDAATDQFLVNHKRDYLRNATLDWFPRASLTSFVL